MAEEKISMNEFKTVVESFRSDIKKMSEVMNHRFDKLEHASYTQKEQMGSMQEEISLVKINMNSLTQEVGALKTEMTGVKQEVSSLKVEMTGVKQTIDNVQKQTSSMQEQIGILLEGQAEMKNKVSHEDFVHLEKRVARLERKVA